MRTTQLPSPSHSLSGRCAQRSMQTPDGTSQTQVGFDSHEPRKYVTLHRLPQVLVVGSQMQRLLSDGSAHAVLFGAAARHVSTQTRVDAVHSLTDGYLLHSVSAEMREQLLRQTLCVGSHTQRAE